LGLIFFSITPFLSGAQEKKYCSPDALVPSSLGNNLLKEKNKIETLFL